MNKSDTYYCLIRDIVELLNKHRKNVKYFGKESTLKNIANQPIHLNQINITNMLSGRYYVSEKIDGERCFVYSSGEVYIIKNSIIEKIYGETACSVLLDAEIYDGTIYAFDCLLYNGERVFERYFKYRLERLKTAVENLSKLINVKKQESVEFTSTTELEEIYRKKRSYPVDGLIFTDSRDYFRSKTYKWKPPEKQTIDFLSIKCPENLSGVKPYITKKDHVLMLLFVGISYENFINLNLQYLPEYSHIFAGCKFNEEYFPIQFSPVSNPFVYLYHHPNNGPDIDGHIIELGWEKDDWKFHRIRNDKDINFEKGTGFGNDFRIAEIIYQDFQNPFTLEKILNMASMGKSPQ